MPSDNSDILSIELLHPLDEPPAFFQRLQRSVLKAQSLRGAVAYWTVAPDLVSPSLAQLLATRKSFLCVDLHLPTSVEMLTQLNQSIKEHDATGRHLFLHLRDLEGQTEVWSANREMPPHLLHTKSLLFDFEDGTAEVWIGSHNWTRRALVGLNVEASFVIRIPQTSRLYRQTLRMLEQIRSLCQLFNPSDVHYYRWLQGLEQTVPILELEGPQANKLADQELKLFGTDRADFKQLHTVGHQIYLRVHDTRTRKAYLYKASIATSSDSATDIERLANGLYTERQRYVVRQGQHLPHLELPPITPNERPNDAAYCATIAVQERLEKGYRVIDPPSKDRWVSTDNDPLLDALHNYRHPILARVSAEYGTAVGEVLDKVTMRLPASAVPRRAARASATTRPAEDEEQLLFSRKLLEVPEKA